MSCGDIIAISSCIESFFCWTWSFLLANFFIIHHSSCTFAKFSFGYLLLYMYVEANLKKRNNNTGKGKIICNWKMLSTKKPAKSELINSLKLHFFLL